MSLSSKFLEFNMYIVAALYKFTTIIDCQALKEVLNELLSQNKIKGTLIIAHEGINGTVAGTREAIDKFKQFLLDDSRFVDLEYKESWSDAMPFNRLKIHIKKEIVTLGMPEINPLENAGTYVSPQFWNQLLTDPDVTVIDVRNDFEVKMGQFKNALNPKTERFSEFPQFVKENLSPSVHKKIAMSCTGGIRCEKASSLMKTMGFLEVFHLKGGVLKYLEEIKKEDSLFEGDCFVFDERIAVDHDLKPRPYDLCTQCGEPIMSTICCA